MTARELERLSFAPRSFTGLALGSTPRGRRTGSGVDFVDYRDYALGDDPRHVDWSVRARTRKLVVRRFHADADLAIYCLLDRSASMGLGRPAKIELGRQLASALARVAHRDHHPVGLGSFASELEDFTAPSRRREPIETIDAALQRIEPRGASSFRRPLEQFVSRAPRRGTVVLLSDFLAPGGFHDGLALLQGAAFQICAVQILASDELRPELDSLTELIDVEATDPTAARSRLRVDATALPRHRSRLAAYNASLRALCTARGGTYRQLTSSASLSEALGALVEAGLLEIRRG